MVYRSNVLAMPPKKNKKTPTASRPNDTSGSTKPCDGGAGSIPQDEALTCSRCHLSLHRYCAGIPKTHYAEVSLNFVYLACTQKTSDTIVSELKDEIAALKAEVLLLKSALVKTDAEAKQDKIALPESGPWVTVRRQVRRANTGKQQHYHQGPKGQQQIASREGTKRNSGQLPTGTEATSRHDNLGSRARTQERSKKDLGHNEKHYCTGI